ncbi:MAG TPA: carboxypeptidase regulatory-like domain-containing protein [Terriglobia bacterium]|nr:carboxypeptidase regulatory-like domain-containing protein [Terriglobia bacterium]
MRAKLSLLSVLTLAAFIAFGLPRTATAQSTFGTLLGTVKDNSGGVIPGAKVTVTEIATSISHSTVTDSVGDWEIPNLLRGSYRVSIQKAGFQEYVQTGIPLDARAAVRVDAVLKVGGAQTVVEVKGVPPVITTETGTVSDTMGNSTIEQLPVNYRATDTSPLNIINTVPGIQEDPSGMGGISISGSHPAQNEISVDGFSIHAPNDGFQSEQMPSTEGVSEVTVTSEVAPAEYGQMGNVEFTTRGGTNQLHGSLFEYLQNDALNAIPDFASSKPQLIANDFGGSIGGPVILPHYNGKDRTFFFFDYEGNRLPSTTPETQNVPTPSMLAGNFSGLCPSFGANGVCTVAADQLTNPFTGQPYPNNQIPSSQFNAVSEKVLSTFYPAENFPNSNSLNATNNFRQNFASPSTTNMWDLRIDQKLTDQQSLWGRFSWKHITNESANGLAVGPTDNFYSPPALGLNYTYALKSNLLNEFRFGYNQIDSTSAFARFPNGAQVVSSLGLQQLGTSFPQPPSACPYFEFDGASGVTAVPCGRGSYYNDHIYQIDDNVTYLHGRHTVKMGLDYREYRKQEVLGFTQADNYGNYFFSGQFTGYDFADFLLGLPDYTAISDVGQNLDGSASFYGFYGQDSFHISPKLTVNYGLRYEYDAPFIDKFFNIGNFNRANGAVIVPNAYALKNNVDPTFAESVNACGLATPVPTSYGLFPCTPIQTAAQAGIPSSLRFADKNMFLPRLSFAYRLSSKTVVRAGAGMYNEAVLGGIEYSLTGTTSTDYRQFNNSFTNGVPTIQFPDTRGSGTGILPTLAGNASFGTANQIDLADPYAEQWSFTLERDLGHDTGLRVTYTGIRSVGLAISPDLNQIHPQSTAYNPVEKPFPNWGVIKSRDNGGSAIFNGLETVVTRRFSAGLTFQSSWEWDKNLSDAEGDNPNGGFAGLAGPRITDRFNLPLDYGNVMATRTHRWLTTAVWNLPFGRGQKFGTSMNRLADTFVGGWSTANILLFQTGPFLTPYYPGGLDPSGTNAPSRPGSQRPDRLPASACSGLSPADAQLLGGSCFFYGWPGPIGRFGNSGVGILTGPDTVNWNFSLSKYFTLNERSRVQFQANFQNFLNHVNLGIPNMSANSSGFGTFNQVQNLDGAGARNIQFALRLEF